MCVSACKRVSVRVRVTAFVYIAQAQQRVRTHIIDGSISCEYMMLIGQMQHKTRERSRVVQVQCSSS